MSDSDYDVAIVGFGPVGAFAALLLSEAGHRVAILERSGEPVTLPRAVGLDGESVRAFQRIGLAISLRARQRRKFCEWIQVSLDDPQRLLSAEKTSAHAKSTIGMLA